MSTTTGAPSASATRERSAWRAVAVPSEHGGWGLTLESVVLGLLVAWSWAGLLVAIAAFVAFVARTPAKLVAIDVRRDRWLPRTRLAAGIAAVELVLLAALAVTATAITGWNWWVAVVAAAPMIAVEAWYEVRSQGRRLVPELCGAAGVAATAAAIVLAGDGPPRLAAAAWAVLAARSIAAIPFVRAQIARARRGVTDVRASDVAQVAAAVVGAFALALDRSVLAGVAVLAGIAALHAWWSRLTPPPVKTVGMRQMALGLTLVAATAIGVRLA
jgi:hypothetical protein